MKPLPGDHRHRLLISGDELRELKRHTGAMAEAFGLDRKIANYKGSRPITLYRRDLDCLLDVIADALQSGRYYPDRSAPGYLALKGLGERLRQEYDSVYGQEEPSPPVSKKTGGRTRKTPSFGKAAPSDDTVYQIKVTLLDTRPPIWRRIRVADCTLDKLHEHIQTAMGWTNSHLHHFRVGEQLYGDPMLMAENFEDMQYKDSTTTRISDIVPKSGQRFRFEYVYDFGDGWRHEVLIEGSVPAEEAMYPVCVEGERACPPEDVGGTWGYEEFLEAMADRRHERHRDFREWIGGRFDPEAFDPAAATRRMMRGLPNWRRML